MADELRLFGLKAVVTGASGGIGGTGPSPGRLLEDLSVGTQRGSDLVQGVERVRIQVRSRRGRGRIPRQRPGERRRSDVRRVVRAERRVILAEGEVLQGMRFGIDT